MKARPGKLLATLALLSAPLLAQPASPHLGFVYPAGGQQGTTLTVSVGGQNLNGTSAAVISGSGVEVRVTGYERPLTQKEINDLRDEAQRLQDKRAAARTDSTRPQITPEDEKRAAEIRHLLATRGNRQATQAIAETVTLEMSLTPGASFGERELRLKTPGGLSNPLTFCVGQLPEHAQTVVTSTSTRSTRPGARDPRPRRETSGAAIALPAVLNGQILPGEADRFAFHARRGQRLTFVVSARALLPYLADAVPGWFQATLAVFDAQGRELAYADDYRFAPDPVIACEIPADGRYFLEIKDALFRGREDFVYRITAGELPFITGIFPLGGTVGKRATVELTGWNLPRQNLSLDLGDKQPGAIGVSMVRDGVFSNSVRFALDDAPDGTEVETGDTAGDAAQLSLPAIINGRVDRPGDSDVFRFTGEAGATIVAEVMARRFGSPLDSVLTLTDEAGRTLAANDDAEDKGAGLLTHHADSRLAFKLPSAGNYFLRLTDAQNHGGSDYAYRLRVSMPQPDFELRVVPSTVNVRAGATVPITVHALRRDGFEGEIALGLLQPPAGFALSGGRIPAGEEKITVTLTAPLSVREETPVLRLAGRAMIDGRAVAHAAVPADDLMQAFAYRHLVPAKEWRIGIAGRGTTLRLADRAPLRITPGELTRIRVSLPPAKMPRSMVFELVEPPPGVAVREIVNRDDHAEIVLTCDPAKARPGSQGNVILRAFGQRPADVNSQVPPQRFPLGTLPAIPFEIVGTFTARL